MAREKKTQGGTKVEPGFYWHPKGWEIVPMPEAGNLPGTPEDSYVRVPVAAMLVAAPVMGGLFVVFLPFLGFALLAHHATMTGLTAARRALHASSHAKPVEAPASRAKH